MDADTLEFTYQSAARAIAIVSRTPVKLQIDGVDERPKLAGPVDAASARAVSMS